MPNNADDPASLVPDTNAVIGTPATNPAVVAEEAQPAPDLPKVGASYIWFQVLGQFGVFIAFITPLAISLAIKVNALAPNNQEFLAYITGSGALAVMLTGPIFGVLSDRTRTRLGRRRPWMIGGAIVGMGSLVIMALAPNIWILGLGWVIAQIGWTQALGNLQVNMADQLPESQRGKVAGLTGFATQIAPVFGVVIAGGFATQPLLLFLIPGFIGAALLSLFIIFVREQDSRHMHFPDSISFRTVFGKYLFNPVKYSDFSLNWAGRFLFYFGLTLNTTFTAFFFSDRLGIGVEQVAGTIAALGGLGVIATSIGAIGGGFISDKLKRRRVLVLVGSLFFAAGVITQAFAPSLPLLFAGSLIASLGIGLFSVVDQALLLDVLPERETEAGRFMGITGFATSIPQAVAPFIAPLILLIGSAADGTGKNYTLLYVVAGIVTVLGGLVVLRIRSVR